MSTPSASRVYNGNALTAAGSVSGFVNGESAPFETTGSQTEVGTSDNTYAIDWAAAGAAAKQANYTVSETVGKLTVTEFAGRVVATPGSYSGTYDGQAHGVDVTVSGLPEGYSVKVARSNATATDATDEAGVTRLGRRAGHRQRPGRGRHPASWISRSRPAPSRSRPPSTMS